MTTPPVLIAPSILSADFAFLKTEMDLVSQAGADWIHVDVMDGHFVPNLTIGPPVIKALKKVSPRPLDVHLMIDQPENSIDAYIDAGCDVLTIHVESTKDPMALLKKIKLNNIKAGITLRPGTALSAIEPFLSDVDLVLVMTVEPGFGGQAFRPEQVQKINDLFELRKKRGARFWIEVDGGINDLTAAQCYKADVLVAGNYVFKNQYGPAIQNLRQAMNSARQAKGY